MSDIVTHVKLVPNYGPTVCVYTIEPEGSVWLQFSFDGGTAAVAMTRAEAERLIAGLQLAAAKVRA
jgi:hypothetical protein